MSNGGTGGKDRPSLPNHLRSLRPRSAPPQGAPDTSASGGGPTPNKQATARDRTETPSHIVDILDTSGNPPSRDGAPSHIVDNMPVGLGTDDGGRRSSDIVDNTDIPGAAPLPRQPHLDEMTPVRLKAPGESRTVGPSGPDADRLRRLRAAHKDLVAARARARGVDPGAGSVETAPGISRSERTHNQYLDRGRMLVRRYRRELDLMSADMDSVNPIEFVNWLMSLKPTISRATWRPYRQAAKAILATMPHDDTEAAIAMIEADIAEGVTSDREASPPKKSPKTRADGLPRRTSGLKAKRFPKSDFDRTLAFLRYYSRSQLAPVLMDWMVAGVTTGLRPIEWQATDLELREDPQAPNGRWAWLYVLNAKATNGRGNGIVRTLDLSHFSDETLSSIRRMSERGSQWLLDGKYDSMQSQCSQLLYSVCARLFSGRSMIYSLYSLRHQFIANAKSFHKAEAVSALVGHVVTDTAQENYAKRNSAWAPEDILDKADPVPEEVSTVRLRLRFFEERLRIQEAAGLIKLPRRRGAE